MVLLLLLWCLSQMAGNSLLSPRLRALVDPAWSAKLVDHGYTSCIVIGNFDDVAECLDAFSCFNFPVEKVAALFASCSDICDGLVACIEKHGLAPQHLAAPEPHPSSAGHPLGAVAMAISQAPIKVQKLDKVRKSVSDIWNILIQAGRHSALTADMSTLEPRLKAEFRSYLMAQWVDLPPNSLTSYVAAFRRLERYSPNQNPFVLSMVQMILYFKKLQEGRPTVALGQWRYLSWLESHLHINFHLQSKLVKDAISVRANHVETQVSPLRVSLWVLFEFLVPCSNILVRGIALFWLSVLHGVLRPAHLQRSNIIALLNDSIEGRATLGKARIFGRRRPFFWRMPRIGVLGTDIGKAVYEFHRSTGTAGHSFFLPNAAPTSAGLLASSWSSEPMSQSRIMGLTHAIMKSCGVPQEVAAQLKGFYAARRVLPTLAHRFKFPEGERNDVGGWAGSKSLNTPQRYSEAKLDEQASVREELIGLASTAVRNLMVAVPSPSLADEVKFTLSQTWHHWPRRGHPVTPPSTNSVRPWLSSMFPGVQLPGSIPPELKEPVDDASSSSSSNSPSSKSSESSCKIEAPGSDIHWQLSKGKNGCLHLCVGHPEDRMLACGRNLHDPEDGIGLVAALSTGHQWSPRCKHALLQEEQDWWHDSHKCA